MGKDSNLLEYLDESEGTDELYEMLRSCAVSEIEQVCKTFPIETLRLDWYSVQRDFRNSRRFELITALAEILVRYQEILEQTPELRLPESLPADMLAETLMGRLIPFIKKQERVEMAEILRVRLYDFAMALLQTAFSTYYRKQPAARDEDALTCLIASKPSIKQDHDFWIAACRCNIAQITRRQDDISAAIEAAEQIVNGEVDAPEECVAEAQRMISMLKEPSDPQ